MTKSDFRFAGARLPPLLRRAPGRHAPRSTQQVGRALKQGLGADGLMIAQLNGAAAGQTVFHYHVHLIPRTQGEPIAVKSGARADDDHLKQQAATISALL